MGGGILPVYPTQFMNKIRRSKITLNLTPCPKYFYFKNEAESWTGALENNPLQISIPSSSARALDGCIFRGTLKIPTIYFQYSYFVNFVNREKKKY